MEDDRAGNNNQSDRLSDPYSYMCQIIDMESDRAGNNNAAHTVSNVNYIGRVNMECDGAGNNNASDVVSDANSCTGQVIMECDRAGNNNPSDTASSGLQRARPLPRRMSRPVAIPHARKWTAIEDEMLRMAVQCFEVKSWKQMGRETNSGIPVKCAMGENWKKIDTVSNANSYTGQVSMARDRADNDNPSDTVSDGYSYICQVKMESDRAGNNNLSDTARSDGLQRARPLTRRMSRPVAILRARQWTAEKDEMLRMAVQRFEVKSWKKMGRDTNSGIPVKCAKGKNWKKKVECFKDRTHRQCVHRWLKVLDPELAKGPWSKEEDELIIELVKKFGQERWSTIAAYLRGRTGKQCRERWHNHLYRNIKKDAWTQDEELALIRAHQSYGNNWVELTKFLPGRTDNEIENHWNSCVEKKLDMYVASGLVLQFNGLSLLSHPNRSGSAASSSPLVFHENHFHP